MHPTIKYPLYTILTLFLIGACGQKKPKSVKGQPNNNPTNTTPDGKVVIGGTPGSSGDVNQDGQPVRAVEKNAYKKYNAAVADYEDAKTNGKLDDRCKKIASTFEASFNEDDELIEGLYMAGTVLLECEKNQDAEAYFDRVLSKKRDYARAITSKGYMRYEEGKIPEAKRLFIQAIDADGLEGSVEARVGYASILLEEFKKNGNVELIRKEKDGASAKESGVIRHLRSALAVNSGSIEAYAVLASAYYHVGYLPLAEVVCQLAIEQGGKDYASIHRVLGLIDIQEGKVTPALQHFNIALTKDPNDVPSLLNAGFITIRYRDYETAKKRFDAVLKLEPKNYEALIGLGIAHRGAKEFKEAEKQYLKAQKLDPGHPSSYLNLGMLYQDYYSENDDLKKKYETAKNYYQKFKSKAGNKPQWASYVKKANERIDNCNQLIRAIASTNTPSNSGQQYKKP